MGHTKATSKDYKMTPQQIVINSKHGGFDLSPAAIALYAELTNQPIKHHEAHLTDYYTLYDQHWDPRDIPRDDPKLRQVVQVLGAEANTPYSHLKIVTIPHDVSWTIQERDGLEWVAEVHRTSF